MKRFFSFSILFLAFTCLVRAHPFAPPTIDWLPGSDTVYLVRVDSVKALNEGFKTASVSFSVTEVLRGKSRPSFTLTSVEGASFEAHKEYILIHNPGGFKDCVGWTIEGDPEWWPIPMTNDGKKEIAQHLGSLDEIRQYLHDHPSKP